MAERCRSFRALAGSGAIQPGLGTAPPGVGRQPDRAGPIVPGSRPKCVKWAATGMTWRGPRTRRVGGWSTGLESRSLLGREGWDGGPSTRVAPEPRRRGDHTPAQAAASEFGSSPPDLHELEMPLAQAVMRRTAAPATRAARAAVAPGLHPDDQSRAVPPLPQERLAVDERLELLHSIEDRPDAHPGSFRAPRKRGNSILARLCLRMRPLGGGLVNGMVWPASRGRGPGHTDDSCPVGNAVANEHR